MKRVHYICLIIAAYLSSCTADIDNFIKDNPYATGTKKVKIQLIYPENFEHEKKAGAKITVENNHNINYELETNADGYTEIDLQYGLYRITAFDRGEPISGALPLFNQSISNVRVTDTLTTDLNVNVNLIKSYSGQLVIKEVYYRGSHKIEGGTQNNQYDKYIIFYNNSDQVTYLDSVCFGCVEPYNAPTSSVPWADFDEEGNHVIMDTIPIIEAIWQFPGRGKDHPLQPGEEAVVAICAAIDHTILYPMSVNLNVPGYWVCYNTRYTNQTYHPTPGSNLAGKWLDLLWKQGTANAFPFSGNSPAPVIFRIPEVNAMEYINDKKKQRRKPNSSSTTVYVMIPSEWVLDGVECFDSDQKFKRLPSSIDNSFALMVTAEHQYLGHTLHRKVDEEATAKAGERIVYMDTNNSKEDFEIRMTQSIKE